MNDASKDRLFASPERERRLGLALDIARGIRRLRKDIAFTVAVVTTLGICLGANAMIFTVVNGVLLNPLPVSEPSSLMLMANQFPNSGVGVSVNSAPRNYYDRLDGVSAFSDQSLFGYSDQNISQRNAPAIRVRGLAATPSLFSLLRADAYLGRTFTQDEGELGNEDRVILSYELWRQLYGEDPAVIGDTLVMSGSPFTIVGVMPRGFFFFDSDVRFWIPLAFSPIDRLNAIDNSWYNIGRLAPSATLEQAQAQVDAVNVAFLEQAPRLRQALLNAGFHTTVTPLVDVLTGNVGRVVYLMWAAAFVILVIGGVNVANLSVVRLRVRSPELVTSMVLGASRLRLAAVLLVESVLLAAAGGALGLLAGIGALRLLGGSRFEGVLSPEALQFKPIVGLFVIGLSLLTGLLVATPPALFLRQVNLGQEWNSSTQGGVKRRESGWRRRLIIAQVALTFILLMMACLFLLTLRNLTAVDPGFLASDGTTTAKFVLDPEAYGAPDNVTQFIDSALEQIRSLPGVTTAAATTDIPLDGGGTWPAVPEGHDVQVEEPIAAPSWVRITPGFFETIGTRLTSGRDFDEQDLRADSRVVIVDEALANRFWSSENVIGKRLFLPGIRQGLEVGDDTRWLTVVGVVPTLRFRDLSGREPTVGVLFSPFTESNPRDFPRQFGLLVKSAGETPISVNALRSRLASIDPLVALYDVQSMGDRLRATLARERLATWLGAAFGLVALLLAAIGLFGVVSHTAVQRRREFGIRLALGSKPGGILKLVILDAVAVAAIGVAIGLAAFWLLGPALASQLYGVSPSEPVVVALVGLILGGICIFAAAVPAHRAASLQPTLALRT